MVQRIDHVVIVVKDLSQASEDFAQAGFTVLPGGEHADGVTHNALIVFGDGSYLELIAARQDVVPQTHPWHAWFEHGEGLAAFALLSDNVLTDVEQWRERGLIVSNSRDGGRQRPDGQMLAWRTVSFSQEGQVAGLPFVIEDVTSRSLRVPEGEGIHHHLPVQRLVGVTLVVGNLAEYAQAFTALLGASDVQDISANSLRFQIGEQWIDLITPDDALSDTGRFFQQFGDSIFAVTLAGGPDTDLFLHGARLRIENISE